MHYLYFHTVGVYFEPLNSHPDHGINLFPYLFADKTVVSENLSSQCGGEGLCVVVS